MAFPISPAESVSPNPAENLKTVLARIETVRGSAISAARSVTLIAVTKTHSKERILPVLEAGHRIFGENRVQEAMAKWPGLRGEYPDVQLHLIGPLQSNKVRDALSVFDAIHSLDRPKLAASLKTELQKTGRRVLLFIQVNIGEEPQKSGIAPKDTIEFVHYCH
jgi:uncharacterized pyridoxal phosphate-containing UPF0001 family protein